MTHHPPPKLLPWLAGKAGIKMHRAEKLWRDACRHADQRAGNDPSTWSALAIDHLIELVTAESQREDAASLGVRPWARAQRRVWSASVQLMEIGNLLTERTWRLLSTTASTAIYGR